MSATSPVLTPKVPARLASTALPVKRRWYQLNTPMRSWAGRRVWLVGASSGIGLACAQALRAAGAVVMVSARQPQGVLDWAAQDEGVQWHPLDVTVPADVHRVTLLAHNPCRGCTQIPVGSAYPRVDQEIPRL